MSSEEIESDDHWRRKVRNDANRMSVVDPAEAEVIHANLNDHTGEGIRHKKFPVFSIQYHPEAAPGPHDARYLFKQFLDMIDAHKKNA